MFEQIKKWYKNNHRMFVLCNKKNSSMIISKKLYESILDDHPRDKNFNVLFSKITTSKGRDYVMFFNPDWAKHGVKDPKMIQTSPVTLGKFGHIGFQTIQPSVMEISSVYGIDGEEFEISVSKKSFNGEPYYLLERCK